ncbi:UPF0481 protein At3g47200-like [Rhodamnia argentea]|uniref:UPF0481 protein At3g47200-like n=1 Tax=Rhodamnia argentea TaxID=178133 RepID=A0A8B8NPI1_9MYRT|nr:UPF0481 protein At3g47200-like [Rhodamnia argentea]
MDSPLLSSRTETCGASESPTIITVPPPLDPSESRIVPVKKSFKCCTRSDQQQYSSIYKVPAYITKLNSKAYQPQVVSLGPYHHDKGELQPMEEHKLHARRHFVTRSRKTDGPFLESLREVAQDLKESYQALDQNWKEDTEDQFLNLMITDGCFMLEIMRTTVGEKRDYAPKNPIFNIYSRKYRTRDIRRDMLMLENQLPMLVLYRLFAVENNGKERDEYEYINRLILRFYSLDPGNKEMGRCLHVLDVLRKGLLMEPKEVQPDLENEESLAGEEIIQSATELEPWIRFKKSKTSSLKDVSFARGVLRLPVITVDDTTQSMFLNLMTFERLHVRAGNEITSYVTFMDNIIDDERDVELLQAQGIIQNAVRSNEVVAKLFNSLCKEVPLESTRRLDIVQKNINEYRQQPWNIGRATLKRWGANLNRTYFRSPWSTLSVGAAIFLFVLTIIQTVYVVLTYYY